jgi:hypothetical protein
MFFKVNKWYISPPGHQLKTLVINIFFIPDKKWVAVGSSHPGHLVEDKLNAAGHINCI